MTWGPFEEKPEGAGGISATRTVAVAFAVVVCFGIVVLALRNHLHDVGWPFAAIAAVTLLAVPLQALFRMLAAWFASSQGRAIMGKVAEKVIGKVATVSLDSDDSADPAPGAAGTVSTTTVVTPPAGE